MDPTTERDAGKPEDVRRFAYWQRRTIVAAMAGYVLFYFLRKNFSFAMPGMESELGITKTSLGIFLTLHGLVYGLSKFLNGFAGDRCNARFYMATGLTLCVVVNVAFGFGPVLVAAASGVASGPAFASALAVFFGVLWLLNGLFQGSGFPPCARLLTHWIPPAELATKMSVWNTSHSIGAVLDWGPTMLKESKGVSFAHAGWMVAAFEIAGIAGTLTAGWVTDRFMQGRAPRTCVFCMAGAALSMFAFWLLPATAPAWMLFGTLLAGGFFIYGPQALTGVTAANISTKKLAGTSIGFIGMFSYASVVVSGVGLGALAQYFGWRYAYILMVGVALAGVFIFLALWNAKAHAYDELEPSGGAR